MVGLKGSICLFLFWGLLYLLNTDYGRIERNATVDACDVNAELNTDYGRIERLHNTRGV